MYRLLTSSYDWVIRHTIPFGVQIQGVKMYGAPLRIYIKGSHEPETTHLAKRVLKKGDVAADIGVHFGYYTLLFAHLVGPSGKVFSFEPGPGNVINIKKGVRAGAFTNVTLTNALVSDIEGTHEFFMSGGGSGRDSIYAEAAQFAPKVDVRSVMLDAFFKEATKVDFIKIDVEGAEQLVLKGAMSILRRLKPKLVIEISPKNFKAAGYGIEALTVPLREIGYSISSINADGSTVVASDSEIWHSATKRGHVNMFCE